MLTREKMKGIYALPPTPFTEDLKLDEGQFRENVRKLCDAGIHGIAILGTGGEFHTITFEEHERLCKALVEEASDDVVTIVGCSGVNTAEAIRKMKVAQDHGADAVINVVPYYFPLSKKECINYFHDIAEACPDIGIIVYNNKFTTQVHLDFEDYKQLAQIPTFCGSKEIGTDFYHYLKLIQESPLQHFFVETFLVDSLFWGTKGFFASYIYVFPKFTKGLYEACQSKNWEEARKMESVMRSFNEQVLKPLLAEGYSEPALSKALADSTDFIKAGPPRKPFIPVPEDRKEKLRRQIKEKFPQLQ